MSRAIAVGLFAMGAILLLATGIFLIGKRELLFNNRYEIRTEFSNVAGLDPGAEVRVGGLRQGTVKDIQLPLTPDKRVAVILSLDAKTRSLIRKDSIASIETEGLLGNRYVAISFGTVKAPEIQDGDSIHGEEAMDYADLLRKTNSLIERTGEALTDARTALKTVNRIGERVESVAAKIDNGQGTIGALVNDRTLYDHANHILNNAEATTETVRSAAEDLTKKASQITEEAKAAVGDIRHTTSTLAKNADPAIQEARQGLSRFNENMEALKQNWFFKGFFKKRGYFDLEKLTENEIAQVPPSPSERIVIPSKKLFDKPVNAELKKKKALEKIGRELEQNPQMMVVIGAYAGEAGAEEENLELTRAQAGVVRRYLIENFKINEKAVYTKGFGESPASPGDPARRLEILLYPGAAPATPTQ